MGCSMGKRERRRRRERAGQPPQPLSIPRRHDQWPTYVRYTGDEMTLQLEVLVERRREAEAAVDQEVDRLGVVRLRGGCRTTSHPVGAGPRSALSGGVCTVNSCCGRASERA